jgi:hypothetical protein
MCSSPAAPCNQVGWPDTALGELVGVSAHVTD